MSRGQAFQSDSLANRSHMLSFVFPLPFCGFKFYDPRALTPNRIFFRCLGINPTLLFIPHLSPNPPFVTSQSATSGDDYNVVNKGLGLGIGDKTAGTLTVVQGLPPSQ